MPTNLVSTEWSPMDGRAIIDATLASKSWAGRVAFAFSTVRAVHFGIADASVIIAAAAGGPLAATIARAVSGIIALMVEWFVANYLLMLTRVILSDVYGAVIMAASLHRAWTRAMPVAHRLAAQRAAKKLVADRTQLEAFTDAAVRTMKSSGWKTGATPQVRTSPQEEPQLDVPDPDLSQSMKERWKRHQSFVDRVADLLDTARALQSRDARLAKSVPKLEKYLGMLRQSQRQLAHGDYDKAQWMAARKLAARAGWGRTERMGGARGRISHVKFKDVLECRRTAAKAVGITRRGIKRAVGWLAKGGEGSVAPAVVDMVVGYQLTKWTNSQKKGRDRIAVTQKSGSDRVELKSQQQSDLASGVETLDSGVKGPPGMVSGPIAEAGLKAVSTILGWK